MTDHEPLSAQPMLPGATTPTTWAAARGYLQESTAHTGWRPCARTGRRT